MGIYKRILPRLGGYLTEDGTVDLLRAGIFIAELAVNSHLYSFDYTNR